MNDLPLSEGKERQRLLELLLEHALLRGDFTLTSGMKSSYYLDGKMVALWPEAAYLIGKEILALLKDSAIQAIGGPTLGADPIVAAVAVVSHL